MSYRVCRKSLGARPCVAVVLWLGIGLLWGTSGRLSAQDVKPTIRLDPAGEVGLEERVQLEISLEVAGGRQADPDPHFQLENFRIVAGPNHSTSIRIFNGVQSTSRSLTWQLQPKEVGKARVTSVKMRFNGDVLNLADQEVQVVEEVPAGRRRRTDPFGRGAADPFSGFFSDDPFEALLDRRRRSRRREPAPDPKIFLRAEARPADPYVGQQVLYTLYLYTQVDIHSANHQELPDFKGFWVQTIPQPDQVRPEMIEHNGERFGKVVLLERALFPRRGGEFEVEPIAAALVARIPDRSPFGVLMPRSREISRTSNAVKLNVRSLPSPSPSGFQGAVGQLSLRAELAPTELEAGEAATLTLELSGAGHHQGIPAPQLPEIAGLEVFPPQQKSSETVRGRKIYGSRTWSFVLVPQRPGEIDLGTIEVPYFDPRAGDFRVAASEPLELVVHGQTRVSTESGHSVELHSIRTAVLPVASGGGSGWSRAAPWLFGLPWGLAMLVVAWRRRGPQVDLEARKALLDRLKQACREERPRQAAALIEDAWREYLARRWEIPLGSPSTQWAGLLVEKGAAPHTADELVKLADDLHYLRYAPKLSSIAELRGELLERSRRLARGVDR